jgi:hypothetical protein
MHNDEDRDAALGWLQGILDAGSDEFRGGPWDKPGWGGPTERLLWELNLLGASVTCVSDQWVRVDAMGILDGRKVESHVQADTFLLALAETYRWWSSATTSEPE